MFSAFVLFSQYKTAKYLQAISFVCYQWKKEKKSTVTKFTAPLGPGAGAEGPCLPETVWEAKRLWRPEDFDQALWELSQLLITQSPINLTSLAFILSLF